MIIYEYDALQLHDRDYTLWAQAFSQAQPEHRELAFYSAAQHGNITALKHMLELHPEDYHPTNSFIGALQLKQYDCARWLLANTHVQDNDVEFMLGYFLNFQYFGANGVELRANDHTAWAQWKEETQRHQSVQQQHVLLEHTKDHNGPHTVTIQRKM